MHHLSAEHHDFAFRADAEPVLRIQPGETVRIETTPEPVERLFAAGGRWAEVLDTRRINAVTGPVAVTGAQPGDALAVEILEIDPADWGWNSSTPGYSLLGQRVTRPALRRLPIRDRQIELTPDWRLPIAPMIGCLGVAPASGESSTLSPPYPWAGNYDLIQAKPGNTLLFPVQQPDALFSLGDLHAAMGDGEATSVSIECAGAATVRLSVRRGLALTTPRIETPDHLYTIGLRPGRDYDGARRQAIELMADLLATDYHLNEDQIALLCSGWVDLTFGGPAGAVVLASIPRTCLPG